MHTAREEIVTMTIIENRIWLRSLGIVGLSIAGPGGFPPSLANDAVIDEIVVTAQKRSQNIQDVNIAVTAIVADEIEELGLFDSYQIAAQAPNLRIVNQFGSNVPTFTIRGVGLNDFNINNNSAVGVYVDEAYQVSPAMLGFQLFDMERVEVLKGPQGTLYGKNTTAGAVNYVSRKPGQSLEAGVSIDYGRWDATRVEGVIGGPLSDDIAIRLAGVGAWGGEYIDNRVESRDVGRADRYAWRLMVDYGPSDNLAILANIHGGKNQSDGGYYQHGGLLDPVTFGLCQAALQGRYDPTTCVDFNLYSDTDNDPYAGDIDLANRLDDEAYGASVKIDWVSEAMTLTSITAFEVFNRYQTEDADASPNPVLHDWWDDRIEQFSQEIRFLSNGEGPTSWIGGLYFLHDEVTSDDLSTCFDDPALRSFNETNFGLPDGFDPVFCPANFGLKLAQETDAIAGFAHLERQLSDEWKVTVAARYTYERKDFESATSYVESPAALAFYGLGDGVIASNKEKKSFNNISGRIAIDYEPTDDLLLYGSLTRGFKSGGFPGGYAVIDSEQLKPYDEEILLAYEVGMKSNLLGQSLRLNAAVFYYDYQDLQVFTFVPTGTVPAQVLTNASDATVFGLDADIWWVPVERLDIKFGVGLLDTELKDYVVSGTDLSGNELANSPKSNYNGMIRYAWALNQGDLYVLADFSYQDEMFFDTFNNPLLVGNSYGLINGRVGFRSADDSWGVSIWGKNLADEEYEELIFDFSDLGYNLLSYGQPRTYGITLDYRFD